MAIRTISLAAALACGAFAVSAQTQAPAPGPLRTAVEKAIQGNPEVAARFNAYRAADDAVAVVRGGFLPRVDLDANVGRDRTRITSRTPETQSVTRSGVNLSVTQLLWDGLATAKDVDRLGFERRARYFEFLDTAQDTALEAARAYYDVVRFRRLVELAEDNYVQHRYATLQINSRVQAGVSRGVDLEQSNARLALAESNLTAELANLHDVTARYQRIVGESPPPSLPLPPLLQQSVPNNATEAANVAIRQSPAISASIEQVRAARATVGIREAAFQPRVEARLRGGGGRNIDAVTDQDRVATAELVMSWNLFNGFSDQARVRQQVNLVNQAADLRDNTCRNERQTAVIAFNDTRRLTEQIGYLERNTTAITNARTAYRQQFENAVGQRGLLDLLNAENEVYTAQRALANARFDQGLAYVRTQAAMNTLISSLGLTRPDAGANEDAGWSAGADAPARCPVLVPDVPPTRRSELDARAQEMANRTPATTSPTTTGTGLPAVPAMTPLNNPSAQPGMPPAPPAVPQRGTNRRR